VVKGYLAGGATGGELGGVLEGFEEFFLISRFVRLVYWDHCL